MSAYCTVQQWRDVLWSAAHPAVSQIGHVHHVIHHQHAGGCGSVFPRRFPVPQWRETEKEPEAATSPVQSMHLKNHKRFLFRSSYWLEAFFRKSSSVCLNVSRRHFLISLSKFSVSPGSKHRDSPIRKAVTAQLIAPAAVPAQQHSHEKQQQKENIWKPLNRVYFPSHYKRSAFLNVPYYTHFKIAIFHLGLWWSSL